MRFANESHIMGYITMLLLGVLTMSFMPSSGDIELRVGQEVYSDVKKRQKVSVHSYVAVSGDPAKRYTNVTPSNENLGASQPGSVGSVTIIDMNPQGYREVIYPDTVIGIVNGQEVKYYPTVKWGIPGNGYYKGLPAIDSKGRFIVAVGPAVLNPNYPESGKIWSSDFKEGQEIDVVLQLKSNPSSPLKVITCIVGDMKAHSFNRYPENGSVAKINIQSGVMQTGISYPQASGHENSRYMPRNADSSVIEFKTDDANLAKTGLVRGDYKLVKILVK